MRAGLLAFLGLFGCRDCPPLGELPVVAEGDEAGHPSIPEIERALADFEAWSGGLGVCPREVRLVPGESMDGYSGEWRGVSNRLRVSADTLEPYWVTIHELCHAWDEGHGNPSQDHPDLFRAEDVPESDLYPTRRLRRAEAFADLCAVAWQDQSVRIARAEHCGGDDAINAIAWLQEEVFPNRPQPERRVTFAQPARREVGIPGTSVWNTVTGVVSHDGILVTLTEDPWNAHGRYQDFTLHFFDADTLEPWASQRIRTPGAWVQLVPGTPSPVLLVYDRHAEATWRGIDVHRGMLGAPQPMGFGGEDTVRDGDVLWMPALMDGRLTGARLSDGEWVERAMSADVPASPDGWLHVVDTHDDRGLVWSGLGSPYVGPSVVTGEVDLQTGEWHPWDLPAGLDPWHMQLVGDEDVLAWLVDAEHEPLGTPVRLSPDGSVVLPADCERIDVPWANRVTHGDAVWSTSLNTEAGPFEPATSLVGLELAAAE